MRCGHMRALNVVVEDASGNRWKDFEVGDRSESAFLRLLDRLPDTACYSSDAYGVYGCLPVNRRRVGKGWTVNRKRGIALGTARQVENGLARRTKGYSKTDGMLTLSLALAWLKSGWI